MDTHTTATPGFDEAERGHGSGDRDSPKDSLYCVWGEPVMFQETRRSYTHDDLLRSRTLEECVSIVILSFPLTVNMKTI